MHNYRTYLLKALIGVGGLFLVSKYFKSRIADAEDSQDFSSESPRKKERTIGKTARRKYENFQWKRLSSNDADAIKSEYKVVVIGSGYGASAVVNLFQGNIRPVLMLL